VCVVVTGVCILVQTQESSGSTTEKWRCFDEYDSGKKRVLVKLTRVTEDGAKSGFGEVSVAGVTHKALFQVKGLNRRWDFGDERDPYLYAFVIFPDGGGAYYDFSGTDGKQVSPKQTFDCVSH